MIVYNALLTDARGSVPGWVQWADGRVLASGRGDVPAQVLAADSEQLDAAMAYIIPGLVDSHVHFREPGLEYKGDYFTESLAAAAGGVVTVFEMPNTKPATTTELELANKCYRVSKLGAYCRIMPLMGLVEGAEKELRRLYPEANACVKLFLGTSTGAMGAPSGKELDNVFAFCAEHNLPIMVHAEDNAIIDANFRAAIARYGSVEAIPFDQHQYIRSREACLRATAVAVELAERFGTRLHIAHVSTADEVREFLSEGPTAGKLITAETTPLYLDPFFADPANRTPRLKVNPAIKTEDDAAALRNALANGAIDTIGTDHAPHLLAEKMAPGMTAASGAPSVQFALTSMMTYLPLSRIVEKMTVGPRDVFGINCTCNFASGVKADFALVRAVDPYEVTDADALSRCAWTPFAGRTLRHRVVATWISGRQVWGADEPALCPDPDCVEIAR